MTTPWGTDFNTFYPANFNPATPDQQPIFFTMNFSTTAATPLEDYMIHVEVTHAEVTVYVDLFTIETSPIIPIYPASHQLNNRDIINNNPVDYGIYGDYDDLLSEIEDFVLESGRMPDGDYNFRFQVMDFQEHPLSEPVSTTIHIRSPIAISLITPGYPLGSLGPMNQMNQFPEFIWFSNLTDYTFELYHLYENVQSAEEIEALDVYFSTSCPVNSFSYPSSAPALEDGETYAWRVLADISSPGSFTTSSSVFYAFKIDMEEEGGLDEVMLINFLNQLNCSDVQSIQNLLDNGYSVTTIWWEGRQITMDELVDILNRVANGELQLIEGE